MVIKKKDLKKGQKVKNSKSGTIAFIVYGGLKDPFAGFCVSVKRRRRNSKWRYQTWSIKNIEICD